MYESQWTEFITANLLFSGIGHSRHMIQNWSNASMLHVGDEILVK